MMNSASRIFYNKERKREFCYDRLENDYYIVKARIALYI